MTKEQPPKSQDLLAKHLQITEPSPWVARFAPLVSNDAWILDLAAGSGRHGRHLMRLGCRSVFIDRNTVALQDLLNVPNAKVINADLENYKLPRIGDIGELKVHMYQPDSEYERGVVGLGEPPVISTGAAISNAVANATGVRVPVQPLTPQRVLEALKGGQA